MLNPKTLSLHYFVLLIFFFFFYTTTSKPLSPPLLSDATSLLAFKSKADLNNTLKSFKNKTLHFCQWQGVLKCSKQNKITHFVLTNTHLAGGVFAPNTLSNLDQLRVLGLQNNSLTGPIPDLSSLVNLKSLFLDQNFFSGVFPQSLVSLHRLRTIDLSFNNVTGPIPNQLASLENLIYLRLDWNRFNGSIPAFNQSSVKTFNVSSNNLTGAVPVTPTLSKFGVNSFSLNPNLCGEIVHKECKRGSTFFGSSPAAAIVSPSPSIQAELIKSNGEKNHRWRRRAFIIGFSSGVFFVICSLLCFIMAVKKQRRKDKDSKSMAIIASEEAAATAMIEQEQELKEKVKRLQVAKSGNLVFCAGEAQVYSLDQLMRGSAELLGRGTLGTTYKAVLDNRLIVCVKRLDANRMAGTTKEMFERHMESVGGLRHPNLVPLRAYFQAREERLLIYDYQPNGSLFSLMHGSKSAKAKPLHWTSCLKIAEDVAQGLSYIHKAWRLVHGNLNSSNVLLGPDFEACIADYCLIALADSTIKDEENQDTIAFKAPEIRNGDNPSTSKSDVYSYGILLLELLTGKPPLQHPFLLPDEMVDWVRTTREDDGLDDEKLSMILEVAMACCLTSPEQRPTMWQVLKMLQEIKESVLMEDTELIGHPPT